MHKLDGLSRGARRIGPCLYMNSDQTAVTPKYHEFESRLYTNSGSASMYLQNMPAYWPSFNFFL